MVLMGIIAVLMVLIVPAFNALKGGGDITKAAYDIAGALEQARGYAIANSTFVWLGFFEDDPTAPTTVPATAGTGRVIISIVASADGTRVYTFSTSKVSETTPAPLDSPSWGSGRIIQISKLIKISGIHLVPSVETLNLPTVSTATIKQAYQVGYDGDEGNPGFNYHKITDTKSVINPTTFSYPLGSTTPTYTFLKIIEFNPRGESTKIVSDFDGPTEWIAVGIQPARGNLPDTKAANVAALTISGLTGATRIHRR